jgi:hypothetical protein
LRGRQRGAEVRLDLSLLCLGLLDLRGTDLSPARRTQSVTAWRVCSVISN